MQFFSLGGTTVLAGLAAVASAPAAMTMANNAT